MDGTESHKNQSIQVISRAAEILRLLGRETGGQSLGQIAQGVGLPRSTVQRIVAALATEGFISTDGGSGRIRLGPEIQALAQASAVDMRDRLRPVMRRISEQTGETVDLAILEGGRMLFVDQVVGGHRLRTVSSIGETFPLNSTANGKAALACLDAALAAQLITEELKGLKGKRVSQVLAEVEDIRSGALAQDLGEHTAEISALGFAIRDQSGDVFAISTPVPSSRFDKVRAILAEAIFSSRQEFGV